MGKKLFEKGQSGNPNGRPKGSRNRITVAVESLLDGEADTITRKAIELAKSGDMAAILLCMDRVAPARRDRCIRFELPKIEKAKDAARAGAAILAAVSEGEMTPSEASEVMKVVESYSRTLMVSDFETRLERLESGGTAA